MKLVINKCYGGYGLSPQAIQKIAERKGRPCFFFKKASAAAVIDGEYIPCSMTDAAKEFIWWAFDVPNPNDALMKEDNWHEMTMEQKHASSALYEKHHLDSRWEPRTDPDLVAVVEALGEAANGNHAELRVVEIPDGIEYGIDEYDGIEQVAEAHRSWG